MLALSQASGAVSVVLLGDQVVEPKADSNVAGSAEAFQTTATTTGTVATLSVYVDAPSRATALTAGLYADNAGHPGALLGQGTLNGPTPGAWNLVSMPAITVTSGSRYWIALLSPTGGASATSATARASVNSYWIGSLTAPSFR